MMYTSFCFGVLFHYFLRIKYYKLSPLFLFLIFVISIIIYNDVFFYRTHDFFLKFANAEYLKIYNHVLKLIMGISGSIMFMFIFYYLFEDKKIKVNKALLKIGENTLGLYLLQSLILEILLARFLLFDNYSFVMFNFIIAPILSLCVIYISLYVIKIIKKNKKMSYYMLGEIK